MGADEMTAEKKSTVDCNTYGGINGSCVGSGIIGGISGTYIGSGIVGGTGGACVDSGIVGGISGAYVGLGIIGGVNWSIILAISGRPVIIRLVHIINDLMCGTLLRIANILRYCLSGFIDSNSFYRIINICTYSIF